MRRYRIQPFPAIILRAGKQWLLERAGDVVMLKELLEPIDGVTILQMDL